MAELIQSISGTTEESTSIDSLSFPLAVESAFGSVFVGVSGDVVRSIEGDNKNWTTEGAGLTGKITALKLHTDGYLYAGTDGGRLYRKNSLTAAWAQVGSAQSTRFHQIASKSGDNVYIAGEDGDIYTSDGSTLTSDNTTGETSVKGVAVWDGKIYASLTAAKVSVKESSWVLQDTLTGDGIDYIWRLLEVDGKLTGVSDTGFHYIHDGLTWRKNRISHGLMQAHAVYLDTEVVSNSSGDVFFLEKGKWRRKHTFTPVVGLATHKGRLMTVVSGDDLVKSVNFIKLINDGTDVWSEVAPSKIGLLDNVKRDGAVSEERNYKNVGQTNIVATILGNTFTEVETRLQLLQQTTERNEFKLWFDEDKYRWGRKSNSNLSPIKDNIQPYSLSIIHDDPFKYANQKKFSHLELSWADEEAVISQTSGDITDEFAKPTKKTFRQRFIATSSTISKVVLFSKGNTGSPSGDVLCSIQDENGVTKKTVTITDAEWASAAITDVVFNLSGIQIGATYHISVSGDQPADVNNFRKIFVAASSNEYNGGHYEIVVDGVVTPQTSGDFWFEVYQCAKSITVNNAGNAHAQPRITMLADSGDLIDTRIINTEPEGRTSFFRLSRNLTSGGTIIFDSMTRQILGAESDAANFFTGDFIEFPKGDNVVKIESAPARYQIEHRDTWL